MFLSRVILNPRSMRIQRELADLYELHRTIMHAFANELDEGQERVLFRVDTDRHTGVPTVLIQSLTQPDWSFLDKIHDYLLRLPGGPENPAWKSFNPHFSRSQLLRFRLRANPTFRRAGKRLAWLQEKDQVQWLARKGHDGGFRLVSVVVVPEGFQSSIKKDGHVNHHMCHFAVRYNGILQVTHPNLFLEIILRGVGSGKAFGFGLLSIAPV